MKSPESFQFNNNTSVKFNLDSFALPVVVNKKKNSIYTAQLFNLKGTKRKLLPQPPAVNTHGYTHAAYWENLVFTADSNGLYFADKNVLQFTQIADNYNVHRLCVANNRLFAIALNRQRLYYSVDLQNEWTAETLIAGIIYIPENYGVCWDIVFYHDKLLVICENGLLMVNQHLVLSYYSDDSQLLLDNLSQGNLPKWESDWFSLGYATDTQNLREVFLQTDIPLNLTVTSNCTQRTIRVKAANQVQKIKTNLRGDQFKLTLVVPGSNFCVTNLAAVVQYGKRGI